MVLYVRVIPSFHCRGVVAVFALVMVFYLVLHIGVQPSSHCRGGGGGSFCLGYGVLPIVLHIGVIPSSHCRGDG